MVMNVNFFTTHPFTVTVHKKDYSLSKFQKVVVILSGIAGLALLRIGAIFGVGAVFTFYGASYLLRNHVFKQLSEKNSLGDADNVLKHTNTNVQSIQTTNSGLNNEKILEQLKKNIFNVTEEIKSIDELNSIEYFSVFYSGSRSLRTPKQTLDRAGSPGHQAVALCVLEWPVVLRFRDQGHSCSSSGVG